MTYKQYKTSNICIELTKTSSGRWEVIVESVYSEIFEDYRDAEVSFDKMVLSQISIPFDHCEKCGCNEFLCGHNQRG